MPQAIWPVDRARLSTLGIDGFPALPCVFQTTSPGECVQTGEAPSNGRLPGEKGGNESRQRCHNSSGADQMRGCPNGMVKGRNPLQSFSFPQGRGLGDGPTIWFDAWLRPRSPQGRQESDLFTGLSRRWMSTSSATSASGRSSPARPSCGISPGTQREKRRSCPR